MTCILKWISGSYKVRGASPRGVGLLEKLVNGIVNL
jgi:hypothetical protein